MRVLWLSPIELPAVARALGRPVGRGGGWIDGLRAALMDGDGLELGIACVSPEGFEAFSEGGTEYLPLANPSTSTRARRALLRATGLSRSLDYTEACMTAVQHFAPDVIHVHGTELTLGLVDGLTDIPCIISIQGVVADVVRHYLDGVSRTEVLVDALRLPNTVRGVGLVPGYFALKRSVPIEARILAHARFFTGRTAYDRRVTELANPDGVYFRCDRVLRPTFYREMTPGPRESKVVYCTGGAAPYKGIEVVLGAVSFLAHQGRNVSLRVAGAVQNSPMGPILQRRARALGVADMVTWLGPLEADAVAGELASCGVFVHASHVDNSPNSLAEAMLRAVPCIASSVGGIPSMVDDGVDGLLFEKGDAEALAAAIDRVLADSGLAAQLGAAARRRAVERHAPQTIATATRRMYEDVLSAGSGSREMRRT
jgi:glycosyltransferase involved in cell wall biosynthesis